MLSAALNPFPVDDLYSAAIMYKQMGFEPISLAPKTNKYGSRHTSTST